MNDILPDFVWWSRRGFQGTYADIDTIDNCMDERHFKAYPWPVHYVHNSRGYRDQEWPESAAELKQCVWCFGDSFTVGFGSPRDHTWTFLLQQQLQRRCVNVSINGISNEWIVRKFRSLLTQVVPDTVVIHWTYTHRRELRDFNLLAVANEYWKTFYNNVKAEEWPQDVDLQDFNKLPGYIQDEIKNIHYTPGLDRFEFDQSYEGMYDEDRVVHYSSDTEEQDTENAIECIDQTQKLAEHHGIKLIHSFIPLFAKTAQADIIVQHMLQQDLKLVQPLVRLDLARDGLHYDIKTATHLVQQIIQLI